MDYIHLRNCQLRRTKNVSTVQGAASPEVSYVNSGREKFWHKRSLNVTMVSKEAHTDSWLQRAYINKSPTSTCTREMLWRHLLKPCSSSWGSLKAICQQHRRLVLAESILATLNKAGHSKYLSSKGTQLKQLAIKYTCHQELFNFKEVSGQVNWTGILKLPVVLIYKMLLPEVCVR